MKNLKYYTIFQIHFVGIRIMISNLIVTQNVYITEFRKSSTFRIWRRICNEKQFLEISLYIYTCIFEIVICVTRKYILSALITRFAAGWSVLANQRCRRDFACCSSLQSGVHPNGRIPAGLGIYCPSVPDYHLAER